MIISAIIMNVVEMLGTVAYALAGAMVGVKKKLDIFGVLLLGMTTACGGGIIRDMILGRTPPVAFQSYQYLTVAFVTSLLAFLVAFFFNRFYHKEELILDQVSNFFDAAGLGIFAVAGVDAGIQAGFYDNRVFLVFLGTLTGIGGGILRDLFVQEMPGVFRKHVYALACIVGATLYVEMLHAGTEEMFSAVVASLFVFFIRILATVYRWNLPHAE